MISRQQCQQWDDHDVLADRRRDFLLDDAEIYLVGNSLGPLSQRSRERILHTVDAEWGQDLVASWNTAGWMDAPLVVGDRLAPWIGATAGEVLVADTTTIMLAKLASAALELQSDRHVILTDEANFHSDLYILDAVAKFAGRDVHVRRVDRRRLDEHLDESVALVAFTHVDFRTGEMLDLEGVTAAVHRVGALMCWDLAHSTGAVPLDVAAANVDLAVGCSYKYLSAGPGSPAFGYVRTSLQDRLRNPLPGWLGHQRPFAFEQEYVAARGIRAFQTSSPSIIAMAALQGSLDVFEQTTMEAVRAKSLALTDLFMDLVTERLPHTDIEILTPREHSRRGSQVSLRMSEAYGVVRALSERGVKGDFREPDVARFGFTPLTLRFVDVFDAVDNLVAVVSEGSHLDSRFQQRNPVT